MTHRNDGRYQDTIKYVLNGRQATKVVYGHTEEEVTAKIKQLRKSAAKGPKAEAVIEAWEECHLDGLSPSTAKGYQPAIHFAYKTFGERYIREITPLDVETALTEFANQGKSTKTVTTYHSILSMIFDYALRGGIITFNPCTVAPVPKGIPKKPRKIPCDSELNIVLSSGWILPFFLLMTGCRRGEALALTYDDINFTAQTITINKSVGYIYNKPYIKSTKTEAGTRTIPLLKPLADVLPADGKGLIFPDHTTGTLYNESHFGAAWKSWQRANHTTTTPHQLRHAYATMLYESNVDIKSAQYLLGHKSVEMTQNIYTHIRQSHISKTQIDVTDFMHSISDNVSKVCQNPEIACKYTALGGFDSHYPLHKKLSENGQTSYFCTVFE